MTDRQPDVVVIGAGPAGLAAAGTAAQHGLHVTLLDEQPEAGGQIYRTLSSAPPALRSILGSDYLAGESLFEALNEVGVTYVPDATVWQIEAGSSVFYSSGGNAFRLASQQVIIATGAIERAMPFAGWTKPGGHDSRCCADFAQDECGGPGRQGGSCGKWAFVTVASISVFAGWR